MTDDVVPIVRANYDAYVTKDRAAIEALIADDFHFTSPLDNRIDRATYSRAAGRTAQRPRGSTSSVSLPTASACSSLTKDAALTAGASATPKS